MHKIEIVACDSDDLAAIQRISRQTFYDTFSAVNTKENMTTFLDNAYSKEQLQKELDSPSSQFYLAKVDGDIAGYTKENFDNEEFELERIYLEKSYQKFGLGKLLVDHAIGSAKLQKADHIVLGVWEHNENAKAFYQKLGFKKIGQHVFQLGDDPQMDYIYRKDL